MTIITNQKNKLKNIYIEFHVYIENIQQRKIVLINENPQINYINEVLIKNNICETLINHLKKNSKKYDYIYKYL